MWYATGGDMAEAETDTVAAPDSPFARVLARFEALPLVAHVALTSFAFFLFVALRTPIDVDEGFYALAAELVAKGKTPYADFFYPQAPLHPYVLAPVIAVLGPKLVVLRVFGALLAACATALVAHAVQRETRSTAGAVVSSILFATYELSWQWLPTVRPYALGAICAVASLTLATPKDRTPRTRELVLAGAIAALAPLGRLPLAPVVGVVALATMLAHRPPEATPLRRGALATIALAAGASVVLHPVLGAVIATLAAAVVVVTGPGGRAAAVRAALVGLGAMLVLGVGFLPFWLRAREGFVYGLVGYHVDTSTLVGWPKTRPFLAPMLGGGALADLSALGTQDVLLLLGTIASLALPGGERRIAPLVGALVLAIGAARHAPHIEHYATPLAAYLAIGPGVLVAAVTSGALAPTAPEGKRLRTVLLVTGVVLFVAASAGSFSSKWLEGMYGRWDMRAFRPARMDAAAKAVAEVAATHPGPVLTMWPGSALGSAARVVPGYEDHFSRLSADKRTPEERSRLHLTTEKDLEATMRARTAAVVVLDRETPPERKPYEDLLTGAGYTLDRKVGDVAIYVR